MKDRCFRLSVFLFLCLFAALGTAQEQFEIVGAMGENVVVKAPLNGELQIGDEVLVVRMNGAQEIILAIAQIDKYQGAYCRAQISEHVTSASPQKGDFLVPMKKNSRIPAVTQSPSVQTSDPSPAYDDLQGPPSASASGPDIGLTVALFTGLGSSLFDGEQLYGDQIALSQSTYLPIGAQLLFRLSMIQIGGEVNFAAIPFRFENDVDALVDEYTDRLQQLQFGGLVRINLMQAFIAPYLRGGAGMYTGDFEREIISATTGEGAGDPMVVDLANSFGFNVGAGISGKLGFLEFVYHHVERETEVVTVEGAGDTSASAVQFGGNNWAIHGGLQFSF